MANSISGGARERLKVGRFTLSRQLEDEPAARLYDVVDQLQGFRNRIGNCQTVIGHNPQQLAHRRPGDHAAVQPGSLMLVIDRQQSSKPVNSKEFQMAEVNNQGSLQPRETADLPGDALGVGRVDFTIDAHHRGDAARIYMHSGWSAVGRVAARGFR